jgi:uncharacterized protein YceH (UPF0502 family)
MSNQVLRAFFFGRALAEVLNEKVEDAVTNALSDLGKFDAEQRERLHQFMEEVNARAAQEAVKEKATATSTTSNTSEDLQETIDELRAEIARLRAELKSYRTPSA